MDRLSFHLSTGVFLKKLVGRKDIEDALQRLEKVAMEETRMAAVEALNTSHGVGDKVMGVDHKVHGVQNTLKAVETLMKGVEDTLQGVDGRVKDIGDKVINGTNTITNLSCPYISTLIHLGVEKLRRQIATDCYLSAARGSKAERGVRNDGQAEELEDVWNRAGNADKSQDAMKVIVTRIIDGTKMIHCQVSPPPSRF
jgi:hypothetical protein